MTDTTERHQLDSLGVGEDQVAREHDAWVHVDGAFGLWPGGTTREGRRAMRISVSNWSTEEADVDLSVAAILRVLESNLGRGVGS